MDATLQTTCKACKQKGLTRKGLCTTGPDMTTHKQQKSETSHFFAIQLASELKALPVVSAKLNTPVQVSQKPSQIIIDDSKVLRKSFNSNVQTKCFDCFKAFIQSECRHRHNETCS